MAADFSNIVLMAFSGSNHHGAPNGILVPLHFQFLNDRLVVIAGPDKGHAGEEEALGLIDSLLQELQKHNIVHEVMRRSFGDAQRPDMVVIPLQKVPAGQLAD